MKRIFRTLVFVALVTAIAETATAQVLHTLEVQRLVAANTPAAHVTLAKHYMALADAYAVDAARYRMLATAPSGHPNHPVPGVTETRNIRRAEAATVLSEGARDMATYHQLLSIGARAAVPLDRARFDGGLGARQPTAEEVDSVVAAARTPADHHALQEYFTLVSERTSADAKAHTVMANRFRVSGQRRGSELAAMHCDRLANDARAAAKKATASAELQRQLADVG